MRSKTLLAAAALATLAAVAPAAQMLPNRTTDTLRFYPDDPLWQDDDMQSIPQPADYDLSKSYEVVANTFRETAQSFGPALNVNTVDEVPDSSWFVNRIGRSEMTLDEVLLGPNQIDGPAPGTWEVTGRPDAGITPKFTIRDVRGDTFIIKLDPASNPELPSSVEIISTKLFHAIGYHVPEDFLVEFTVDRLRVAEGARATNERGKRVPIRQADVERWLRPVQKRADGSIRALASRYVPGKVVGQFKYNGRRTDDPNDLYPHERRRELRAMRVFAAWLNHDDARANNSIDTYVEDGGRRYIRHYMQDFGSNLGSGSTSAQQPRAGYEYLLEPAKVGKGLLGLGLYRREWMNIRWPKDPSIGNIEADTFDPATWKTEYPNPAFKQLDAADAFWAARIMSRFTDEMIRAIVDQGQLSNASAATYLADVIIKRRDKTVRWGITATNPLDRFEVQGGDAPELVFDNAAVRLGVAAAADVRYSVRWASLDNRTGQTQPVGAVMDGSVSRVRLPADAWGPADTAGMRYAQASIVTHHAGFEHWVRPVIVTIRNRGGMLDVVGIERPSEWAGTAHRREAVRQPALSASR